MLSLKELVILINLVEHEIDYEIDNNKFNLIIRDDNIRELEKLRSKLVKKYNGKIEKIKKERGEQNEQKKKTENNDIRR